MSSRLDKMVSKEHSGKGTDRKGTQRDGLKWKWQWVQRRYLSGYPQDDTRRLPCQCCEAFRETKFGPLKLEATAWHNKGTMGYEASIAFCGNRLHGTGTFENLFGTRLAAQRAAERLMITFATELLRCARRRMD